MERESARVAGIVLAAGASTRMGTDKLLAEVGGEPLLRRAVRVALAGGLDPVIVVLGPGAAAPRDAMDGLPCTVAVNVGPERGLGSSLAAGVAALPDGVDAAVVTLPDMPRVTSAMIAAVVSRWREAGAPIVLSDYSGTIAPPVLWTRPLFAELAVLDGESAGKEIVERHGAEAVHVPWPAAALSDVDTPADLEQARAEGAAPFDSGPAAQGPRSGRAGDPAPLALSLSKGEPPGAARGSTGSPRTEGAGSTGSPRTEGAGSTGSPRTEGAARAPEQPARRAADAESKGAFASGDAQVLWQAAAWLDSGRGVALATVVSTWGSSPRPPGSLLAVNDGLEFVGSVSGGCVEAAVVEAALEVIRTGAPRRLRYGVTDERAWAVGLACGGTVEVFVERVA
jgi:molybdenum cofactor cytidylyltransferase